MAALRDELGHYIAAARRTGGRKVRATTGQATPSSRVDRERNRAIHRWANENGYEIADRGRLSSEVIAAFERAEEPTSTPVRKRASQKKVAAAKK